MVFRKYKPVKQWGKMDTRIFKEIYNSRNKRKMPSFIVPDAVKATNAKVYETSDPFLFENQVKNEIVQTEAVQPFAKPEISEHPLYHQQKAFVFEGAEPLSDGVAQAQILANCVVKHGLPETILHSAAKIEVEESLVKDAILHGEKYDPTLEKLPIRFDPVMFWIRHVRLHGTPVTKKNNIILNNLMRHVQFAGIHSGNLKDHMQVIRNAPISAVIQNPTLSLPFVIRGQPHLTLQTQDPAVNKPWAGPNDVQAFSQESIPDIYPLSPVIDLQTDHLYNDNVLVPREDSNKHHIHSILWSREQDQKYPWTREQNLANAILQTYGTAVAQATRAGGQLKAPILVRGAQIVDGRLDLVAFQLNTLNSADESVRNIAWVEKGAKLYEPKPYYEQMLEVENLDMAVFKKFAALLLGFGSQHAH